MVAPLAGARIEITLEDLVETQEMVAPLAGARIEISLFNVDYSTVAVAPLAGARIEIFEWVQFKVAQTCRSPRGSAD